MKYTKGEWKLHGLTIETHYSPEGHVIAIMNDIGNRVMADAHLIAAAPDMYEALKGILSLCNGYTELDKETCALYITKILAKAEEIK